MLHLVPPYWLFETTTACWHCGCITPVIAFGAVGGQEVGEDGESDDLPDQLGTLCYVTDMPEAIRSEMQSINPNYRIGFSATAKEQYFANHCAHCEALQGDHHVHSSPDEAFFQTDESRALSTITVRRMNFSEPAQVNGGIGGCSLMDTLLEAHEPGRTVPKNPKRRKRI